ncbi:hypothetical protein TrVE_jg638 [Triparma verrucosa]|uniref:Uncharacterized protein n=1 Tax=Triparma verrucosa TaxID=1606542 RepID=A0A9W7FEW7_9STRA|nr:hypothetical protein TrVE_jg638 [Triparma verrucosa]
MENRRLTRGQMYNGDAMRGVFGGIPAHGQYNQQKRASMDGLAARQAAVAEAYQKAQKELADKANDRRQRQTDPPAQASAYPPMFPQISPRANPYNPPNPPSSYQQPQQQLNQQRERDRRQPYNYGVKPERPAPENNRSAVTSNEPSAHSDAGSSKMLQIVTSMSQRISESENDLSKLSKDLSSLTNNQASMNMKLASFPTMEQLASLKQQFESNTTVMNEAATNANQAHVEVNKLGLQLFEQNTKINGLVELGKDFDKSSMQLDSLRLEVDELKGSQPMLKSIDNDVSQFRREFHSRLAEESEFRDSIQKKNQVLFNELVRLGEGVEKDRNNGRAEIGEMGGILTGVEKRLKSAEDMLDRTAKAHGGKLVNLDATLNTYENAISAFGRDVQNLAGSVSEERKVRKNAVDNLTSAMDEIRGAVSDRLGGVIKNVDGRVMAFEEQIRGAVDGVRNDSERSRGLLGEEIRTVAKNLGEEATSRQALNSELSLKINATTENTKQMLSSFWEDVSEQLLMFKAEENEMANQSMRQQEEIKKLMASLEKDVFETQTSTNGRIDRTRAALEEVLRAEIQSRQSTFSSLEGRVREIVGDCITSVDSVSSESRMAVDALANRVNSLEVSMMKVIEGKITVVEEAVAARQNEQENVNNSIHNDLSMIRKKEEDEHVQRVAKEDAIVERVTVVENRVEGEIDDVRKRVVKAHAETTEQVATLETAVNKRCDITEDNVKDIKELAETNRLNVTELTNTTSLNFDMVREDAVKSKAQIAGLKVDIGDVDDKIGINNLMTTGVDMVVGAIEKEEKVEAENAMKMFFQDYVRESERKLVEKEEERERAMKRTFEENMKKMEEDHKAQLADLTAKMQAEIAEERRLESEANQKIRGEMRNSIEDLEVKTTVTEVLLAAMGRVEEQIRAEEVKAERKRAEEVKAGLEELLAEGERERLELVDKVEQLTVIVNEREKLEGQEWARILEGGLGGEGGMAGAGGEGEEVTGAPLVLEGSAGSFPKAKQSE